MVQSGSGLWHFPGGGIEINEDIFSGIKREYREETGYSIKIEPQIYHFNEQRFYHSDIMFVIEQLDNGVRSNIARTACD